LNSSLLKRLAIAENTVKLNEAGCASSEISILPHIADCYVDLLEDIEQERFTYFNLPGGRGSAKSSFVSLVIVKGVASDPTGETNAICFRLVADTMGDSVFAQNQWAIDTLGMSRLWKSTTKPLRHTYIPTGAQIIYKGLDKAEKLKSIRPKRGIFRYIWLEEFAELPGAGFVRNVMQSVIRGKGQKFTVFRSFNPPISKNNWANTFIQQPDPKAKTLLTNYTMIPPEWLGEEFIYEAERLRELNPDAYRHEYLGEAVGTGGEVFPTLEIREITQAESDNMEYIYQGVDFGFAADPACFIRLAYDRKYETIYLLDEIYKRNLSNKALAEEILEKNYDDYEIVCDAAEPKSINDIREIGREKYRRLNARSCYKAPGCVEYRIKWLQHRKIVIDPRRTPNASREFVNYSYPVDKNGEILSQLVDKDNHSIDAVAYALTRVIFSKHFSA
jgi:PBSX family phage terminase large subunit